MLTVLGWQSCHFVDAADCGDTRRTAAVVVAGLAWAVPAALYEEFKDPHGPAMLRNVARALAVMQAVFLVVAFLVALRGADSAEPILTTLGLQLTIGGYLLAVAGASALLGLMGRVNSGPISAG